MEWLQAHWALIATVLWLVSDLLGEIPSIKANSIFGLAVNTLKSLTRTAVQGEADKLKSE